MARQYECECLLCGTRRTQVFREEPFPEVGEVFLFFCSICGKERAEEVIECGGVQKLIERFRGITMPKSRKMAEV